MPAVAGKAAGQAKAEPLKAASTLPGATSRPPEKPTEKPPVKSTAKPVKVTAPPKSPEARFPPGLWGIQLGSFSDKANAATLSDKLQAARYPSFLADAKAKSGALYKVIVGPYNSREAAEKIRDEISKQQGLKGFLTGLGK